MSTPRESMTTETTESKRVQCPRCMGRGFLDFGHYVGDPQDGCWNAHEVDCPKCWGHGEIEVTA